MTGSIVIPCLRHHDAKRMISSLCDAFAFHPQAVQEDRVEGIAPGRLMLRRQHGDAQFRALATTPSAGSGLPRRRSAARPEARIWRCPTPTPSTTRRSLPVRRSPSQDEGGGGFSCRDPEWHLWNVGAYGP